MVVRDLRQVLQSTSEYANVIVDFVENLRWVALELLKEDTVLGDLSYSLQEHTCH